MQVFLWHAGCKTHPQEKCKQASLHKAIWKKYIQGGAQENSEKQGRISMSSDTRLMFTVSGVVLGMFGVTGLITAARQPNEQTIVEIVERLEKKGYKPVTGVSREREVFEVEAAFKEKRYKLRIDAATGKILSKRQDGAEEQLPSNAKPLSEILKVVMKAGYKRINDTFYEGRYWVVETRDTQGTLDLHVDPVDAKIVSVERED